MLGHFHLRQRELTVDDPHVLVTWVSEILRLAEPMRIRALSLLGRASRSDYMRRFAEAESIRGPFRSRQAGESAQPGLLDRARGWRYIGI